jgi:peptide/nickel transport system permease protein
VLVRYAPGYLSDAREMDPRYANAARAELSGEAARSVSPVQMITRVSVEWIRGDGGLSRQFGIPVFELIRPRLALTGRLMLESLLIAWLIATCASTLSSLRRRSSLLWQIPATVILATPAAAMATLCLFVDRGGPVLVLALLVAARDFKFLHQMLRKSLLNPCVLQARAQGLTLHRILWKYVLPSMAPQLAALASLSLVTALSAIVPVEVIFNVPGLGQLAWNAAMNRDLPVLLAITVIMALAATLAGLSRSHATEWENA